MRKLNLAAFWATIVLFAASCQKQENVQPQLSSATVNLQKGKEDDDGPIIMHVVLNEQQLPLVNVPVIMSNDQDTVVVFTDSTGRCQSQLPEYGEWRRQIRNDGYKPYDSMTNLTDSFSIVTIILQRP